MNYFLLFGLPTSYQIDVEQMTSIFQDLQRQYHPDKFIGKTQSEQMIAMEHSININQAWKVLKNPLLRAKHLLSLHGFNVENSCTIHDRTFLTKQLELHEELEKIKQKKNKSLLEAFIKRIKKTFNTQYTQMVDHLNNEKWDESAKIIYKLHFLDKLKNNAEQLEEKWFNF